MTLFSTEASLAPQKKVAKQTCHVSPKNDVLRIELTHTTVKLDNVQLGEFMTILLTIYVA